LRWETATEIHNYGFAVERSIDGAEWNEIGFVPGWGMSAVPRSYTFIDNDVDHQSRFMEILRYRLRQIDRDGSFEYSPVVQVRLRPTASVRDFELSVAPNPARDVLHVSYRLTEDEALRMALYDMLGREVLAARESPGPGWHVSMLPVAGVSSGQYILALRTGSGSENISVHIVR